MSFKNNYIELSKKFGGPYSLITRGIKKGIVQSIMRGSMPKVNEAHEVAKVLGVSLECLLIGEEEKKPSGAREAMPSYGNKYSEEEQEYIEKLVALMKKPDSKVTIKIVIDTFLKGSNIDPRTKVGKRSRKRH